MNFEIDFFVEAMLDRAPLYIIEHFQLVLIPLAIALVIAYPAGVLLTRPKFSRYTEKVMSIFNAGQTIPPLAVIAVFFPFLGLGYGPAVVALSIYALLPIARNTLAGISSVPYEIREAARGMGMTEWQIFKEVEMPLSFPVVMSGIKTSAVLTAGTAALAALVGGRGMGAVIFAGINFFRMELILAGTLYIGIIALVMDRLLSFLENLLTPIHMK
ncbi:MAG TPA: ABC transporter permease [Firmicutes bacterium]|nr:ABC transporter permease [Bacillota bacterium]